MKKLLAVLIPGILFFTAFGLLSFPEDTGTNSVKKEQVKIDGISKSFNNKEKEIKSDIVKGESLLDTVKQGGSMMIPILILALIALTMIIERSLFYFRNKLWKSSTLKEYLTGIAEKSKAGYSEELEDDLRTALRIHLNKMERGLAILNGAGNLSPLMGFLGTVVGMIKAFASIAAATTVNAKVVAVGIQIALVTTAGGLSVAVPALFFYYIFIHIIQNNESYADEIIAELSSALPKMSENE